MIQVSDLSVLPGSMDMNKEKESRRPRDILRQMIDEYLLRMIDIGYTQETIEHHEYMLKHFYCFVSKKKKSFETAFAPETLEALRGEPDGASVMTGVKGLIRYLVMLKKIEDPLKKENRYGNELPEICADYMDFFKKTRQVGPRYMHTVRKNTADLYAYPEEAGIRLPDLNIEHIDRFLAQYNKGLGSETFRISRSCIRGFLRYLYFERRIIRRDLASMLTGPPVFARSKPPKYLRPCEVRRLFESMTLSTPAEIRTGAMLHLAYSTGLRPGEISMITLDDISFKNMELTLPKRKGKNPVKLPLPEETIKAIAAYLVGVRPETGERRLFPGLKPPYAPVSRKVVTKSIGECMRRANLPATAYWLRHTYAQNLPESGASIFEIKEMPGHDSIRMTSRYLHIHTSLMRKVLFDESV